MVTKGKEITKDIIKEKDLIKEIRKDKVEIKEITKDKDKEFKERKEIKEKDFVREKLRDIGFQPSAQDTAYSSVDLESRVGALEQMVGELTHFIAGELRPDLQSSALSEEADLIALSQQLQQQANDAKSAKDNKDIEKLRET